jgi:hypothetical protein
MGYDKRVKQLEDLLKPAEQQGSWVLAEEILDLERIPADDLAWIKAIGKKVSSSPDGRADFSGVSTVELERLETLYTEYMKEGLHETSGPLTPKRDSGTGVYITIGGEPFDDPRETGSLQG